MDQPVELQLNHWLRVAMRRARLMVAIVLVCAAMGLATALLSSSTYTAHTTLLLQQSLSEQGAEAANGVRALAQLAESELVRNEARQAVGAEPELGVGVSPDGQVLTFRATAGSAELAQRAANAYGQAFVALSESAAAQQLDSAQKALQRQVDQLDRSLARKGLTAGARAALIARRGDYAAALNKLLVRRELLSGGQAFVVSLAKAPTAADPRKTGLHVLVGTVFGLVVAVVLTGLVDRREDLVRSEHDLAARLAGPRASRDLSVVPLVPVGRRGDRSGSAVRGSPAPGGSQIADSYAVLRASMETGDPPTTRVIMVAEAGRGGRAATVAVNLGAAFARAGKRTLVTSLDFRDPSTPPLAEEVLGPSPRTSRKIIGLSRSRPGTDEGGGPEVTKLFPLTFVHVPGNDNLAVVTSGRLHGPEELVSGQQVQMFLDSLADIADVVVLELPPVMAYPDAMLVWPYCHDALLVARLGQSRTPDVLSSLERLESRAGKSTAIAVLAPSRRAGELQALLLPAGRPADRGVPGTTLPFAVNDDRVV